MFKASSPRLLALAFMAGMAGQAQAQSPMKIQPPIISARPPDAMGGRVTYVPNPAAEAERDHQTAITSSKQLSLLSSQVSQSFQRTAAIGPDDEKKLSSIEKLARKVLKAYRANVDKQQLVEKPTVAEAVSQLNQTSGELAKTISEQTRFTLSASVVDGANQIIRLARFLRTPGK